MAGGPVAGDPGATAEPGLDASVAVAGFTWQMEPRFGRDDDRDGIIDYRTNPVEVQAPFQVTFDACASSQGDSFLWRFPRVALGCRAVESFPKEGTYPIRLTVTDSATGTSSSILKWVTVRDWLIVSVGDSTASGDGTPDISGNGPNPGTVQWQDRRCHRSALAGPAKAALALEQASTHSSVTFVHLACSGGSVENGLLNPTGGQEPPTGFDGVCDSPSDQCLPPQLDQAFFLAGNRQIDAMLVQGGANDIPFTEIVVHCFAFPTCYLHGDTIFARGVAKFPSLFQRVANRLATLGQASGKPIPANRVFLTEYFDPTHSEISTPCLILGAGVLAAIDPVEAAWASDAVIGGFKTALQTAASKHGWSYVGGIASAYKGVASLDPNVFRPGHGYCAHVNRWITRAEDSFWHQNTYTGAFHPNYEGQAFYGQRLAADVTAAAIGNDTAAPTVAGAEGFTNGASYVTGVSPSLTIDDLRSGVASVAMRLDGQAYEYGTPVTAFGPHTLSVTAVDVAGNSSTTSFFFSVIDEPAVSIGDVAVEEGNLRTSGVSVTVTLARMPTNTVELLLVPEDGTARAPADYVARGVMVGFDPRFDGLTKTAFLGITPDAVLEETEFFNVYVAEVRNASIGDGHAVVTILDDDIADPPTVSVRNVRVGEGDTGTKNATFTVALSRPNRMRVTVGMATEPSSATSGADFTPVERLLVIEQGATTASFTVPILGDLLDEPDERFVARAQFATGSVLVSDDRGVATIVDQDPVPKVRIDDVAIQEGASGTRVLRFTVRLSAASGRTVTARFATANRTAMAPSDYVARSGTLTFAPGTTSKSVAVTVKGDNVIEPNETFVVNLSAPSNAALADAQGVGTILRDTGGRIRAI